MVHCDFFSHLEQSHFGYFGVCEGAAINSKWNCDETLSEQKTSNEKKRQYALNCSPFLGGQVVWLITKTAQSIGERRFLPDGHEQSHPSEGRNHAE